MSFEVRLLTPDDHALLLATPSPDLFDDPVDSDAARAFLADPRHHIVAAIDDGSLVGFVSAVHYLHPDKRLPELWINEVSVVTSHRKRGIGKLMMAAMLELAGKIGCSVAWVLTDRDNAPAMRLYTVAGGVEDASRVIMYEFDLEG